MGVRVLKLLSDLLRRFQRRYVQTPQQVVRPAPITHNEAAVRLIDRTVINSPAYKDAQLRASRAGNTALIEKFGLALLDELQRRGIPMFPHCWYRSGAVQNELFKKGRTKAKAGQSAHNHGLAVDIVHFEKAWGLDKKEWAVVGQIGKEVARRLNLSVTWGGDWNFYDPAHWEIADWKAIAAGETAHLPVHVRNLLSPSRAG